MGLKGLKGLLGTRRGLIFEYVLVRQPQQV